MSSTSPTNGAGADAVSLRRGLEILIALAGDEALDSLGLGVSRIAEVTGREKTRVSRSLKTLAEYGMVERDPATLRYRLGWRLFVMASRAGRPQLLELAKPLLARLVTETGEGAFLTVLRGADVLTVASRSSPHVLQARNWVGSTVPAFSSAPGQAMLVDHTHAELVELLGRAGDAVVQQADAVEQLQHNLEAARRFGYAAVIKDAEIGYASVGAPVRDLSGAIIAALNVSGPEHRLREALPRTGDQVRSAASELSALLGWSSGSSSRND